MEYAQLFPPGPHPAPRRVAAWGTRPAQALSQPPALPSPGAWEQLEPEHVALGSCTAFHTHSPSWSTYHFSLGNQAKTILKCPQTYRTNLSTPAPTERPTSIVPVSSLGTSLETPALEGVPGASATPR